MQIKMGYKNEINFHLSDQQKKHSTTGIEILKKSNSEAKNLKEMKSTLKATEIEQITQKREISELDDGNFEMIQVEEKGEFQ